MNLSEHFTKEEFTFSETANKYKIKNEPNSIQLKTLKHTCQYFFEPLRKLLNETYKKYNNKKVKSVIIKITSGLRTLQLNRKIGSKDTSQHITGEAADFKVVLILEDSSKINMSYQETYNFIKKNVKEGKLSVDQCICERNGDVTWVHCSYKAGGATVNRKQFLTYDGKTYKLDK